MCARCKAEKPAERKDVYCKSCRTEYARAWRLSNPEAQRAAKKRWEKEHPEEVRAGKRLRYQADLAKSRTYQRKRREENPERFAEYARRRREKANAEGLYAYYRHGLTLADRRELEAKQNHKCPLCDRPLADVRVHVDHDHETGKVRGILCQSCNTRLGWYENRPDLVRAYLDGLL